MQSMSPTQRAAVTWLAVCVLATLFAVANAQATLPYALPLGLHAALVKA